MTPEQLAGLAQAIGVVGLLIAALYGLYKQWWVPGWAWRALVQERDEWKQMALGGLQAAADLAQATKQHTIFTPEEADVARQLVREAGRRKSGAASA